MTSPRQSYEDATRGLEPPFAAVDLAAFRANATDLAHRSHGRPIRVASKSVRCRDLLRTVLDLPGYQGVMAFTLPEALWLATDDDNGRVREAYGDDTYRRLADVKARYDPDNIFHHNKNIRPG